MATLPRTGRNKSPIAVSGPLPATTVLSRRFSETGLDFDSGINSSNAWTEHLERSSRTSNSDDEGEPKGNGSAEGKVARALYDFEGKAEFQELVVEAGDQLIIVKEDLPEGWSLARHGGRMGLIPRSYFIYTTEFITQPAADAEKRRDASDSSVTPRNSMAPENDIPPTQPLQPQNTGDWLQAFPGFRRSILGGRSLNRFSSFVSSGAEDWILNGHPDGKDHDHEDNKALLKHSREESSSDFGHLGVSKEAHRLSKLSFSESERHYVEPGPSWKAKVPPFSVLVHSPSKHTSTLTGAYTLYCVTSLFPSPSGNEHQDADDAYEATRITVHRRFSHFVFLHTVLGRRLPGVVLPPLPEKQYAGRFNEDFVEARRGDLHRYLNKVVRHPIARYAEVLTFFLSCDDDKEWARDLPYYLSMPAAGASFYAHVYHPAFNVDMDEAAHTVTRVENHTKVLETGVQDLRNIYSKVRTARAEMSSAERLLSYSLLSLITSRPLGGQTNGDVAHEDDDEDDDEIFAVGPKAGLVNAQGAWCWREDCSDCLKLTKSMQKTSDALQSVADLYDDHARRTMLATHESFKDVAHPSVVLAPVLDTHKATLRRHHDAVAQSANDSQQDAVALRCETVINATMSEIDVYHTQKVEDFERITKEHLDDEIAFYEKVLTRLRTARASFDNSSQRNSNPNSNSNSSPNPNDHSSDPDPRRPSMYEHQLSNPRLSVAPLPQPCAHVYDSAPMKPVNTAIQTGVSILLGGPSAARASVLSHLW